MKRHPSAVTRPPSTAVRRVDFRRQMAIVRGETASERAIENAPTQPANRERRAGQASVGKQRVSWAIGDVNGC